MYCEKCGALVGEGSAFCPNCGAPMSGMNTTAREDDDEYRTVLVTDEEQQSQQTVPERAAEEETATVEEETSEISEAAGEETAPEETGSSADDGSRVEAIEISSTGVVEEHEARMVPAAETPQIKFCPNCGAQNGINDLFCQSCGMFFGNADKAMSGGRPNRGKQGKKIAKLAIALAAAAAVIAACIILLPKLFGSLGGDSEEYLFYLKDDELNTAAGRKWEARVIEDRCFDDADGSGSYSANVSISPDGKYVFYPHRLASDGTYDLYRKKLGSKKAEEEEIASDVLSYELIDDDKLIYFKDSVNRKIYLYDGGEEEMIDNDVSEWYVSEDGKNVAWRAANAEGSSDLYIRGCRIGEDKDELESDIERLYAHSADLKTYVYGKDDHLYIMQDKEEEQIAKDVMDVMVYDIDSSAKIYYTKEGDAEETSLYDLIEDDFPEDQDMEEPDEDDYREQVSDPYFGVRTKTSDAYYEAMDSYNEKRDRDRIREDAKNDIISDSAEELYYYDAKKGESNMIVEASIESSTQVQTEHTALMCYWLYDIEKADKIKLSRLMELEENDSEVSWYQALRNNLRESMSLFCVKDGNAVEVEDIGIDKSDIGDYYEPSIYASEKPHALYLVYGSDGAMEIYTLDYNALDQGTERICDDAVSVETVQEDGIYYLNEDGDLYCGGSRIDSDVYDGSIRWEDGMVLYLTDISKDGDEGTLKLYRNGKAEKIADDVANARYAMFDGDKTVFLTDYTRTRSSAKRRGDLQLYDGRDVITIDSDVSSFFIRGGQDGGGMTR